MSPLSPKITPFKTKIYNATSMIPPGKITTYGRISAYVHSTPRRVAGVLRINLFAPVIPCHRVISNDQYIASYRTSFVNPSRTVELTNPVILEKIELLRSEGVYFDAHGFLKNDFASILFEYPTMFRKDIRKFGS